MRPWFGSAVLACAIHSFLGGGNKQPVELLADEDGDYPASVADAQMDGRTASGANRPFACSMYHNQGWANALAAAPKMSVVVWSPTV